MYVLFIFIILVIVKKGFLKEMSTSDDKEYKIIQILKDKQILQQLRQQHVILYATLHKVIVLFDKHKIKYSLFAGNVLGQLRNQELILWDDDIDLVILDTELYKFKSQDFIDDCYIHGFSIIQEEGAHYHMFNYIVPDRKEIFQFSIRDTWSSNNIFGQKIAGNSKQIDIFTYTLTSNEKLCDYTPNILRVFPQWKHRFIHYNDIVNTNNVKFGPLTVKQMSNPHKYLQTFIKEDYINSNHIVTHLHSNILKKYLDKLPYVLDKKEITTLKKFSFNISFDEIENI